MPEEVLCIVEIPKGSRNKYEWDEERRLILFDRFLSSSVVFPTDYGFVAESLGAVESLIEHLREILDLLDLESPALAGHSLGGFMSLAFQVASPQRVQGLILQGCGPGYRNAEARATWNAIKRQQHDCPGAPLARHAARRD